MQNALSSYYQKFMRIKNVENEKKSTLAKTLTWVDLIGFGVGCVVGAGIFVLTGFAASESAGPAISLSFFFDFFATALSALCYTEFAARHPVAGSAYIYAYISVGEIWAFTVGWAIMVSYTFTIATVSRGWVGYLDSMLSALGTSLPSWLQAVNIGGSDDDPLISLNPLAAVIVIVLTLYTLIGMRQSSMFNLIVTCLSIAVIMFVIVAGSINVDTANWTDDFFPYGAEGVFKGAAVVFFAYLGFDAIANFSEEVKNPSRDLPIGIIGSLLICSVLYVLVSLVVTGMQPYNDLDPDAPLSVAFEYVGWDWAAVIVSLGAFAGLTTTMLVALLTSSRIAFAMSRDGLLPSIIAYQHPSSGSTIFANSTIGVIAALISFTMNIEALADVVSICILFAFIVVSVCIFILRVGDSDADSATTTWFILCMLGAVIGGTACTALAMVSEAPYWVVGFLTISFLLPGAVVFVYYVMNVKSKPQPTFQTPLVPLTPLLAIIVNVYMMCNLQGLSWIAFLVAMVIGLLLYFFYGVKHSHQGVLEVSDSEGGFTESDVGESTAFAR